MEQNTTRITRSANRLGLPRHDQLRWLEVSFTTSSFDVLKSYRTKLSIESGQPVTFARALDALIKSHPVVTGEQR